MNKLISKLGSGSGRRYIVWLVNLLLLLFLAQTVATLTWRIVDEKLVAAPPAASTNRVVRPKVSRQSVQVQAQQLASRHLFGQAVVSKTARNSNTPIQAPETKLALTLKGVLASGDQATDVAIIAPGKQTNAPGKPYAIGDSLPNGASLKEIYGDRVILETRGRAETLTLNRKLLENKQLLVKQ